MERLEAIRNDLMAKGYPVVDGYFTRIEEKTSFAKADATWSRLSSQDPAYAAAAIRGRGLFVKYPVLISDSIQDGDLLVLDAGCGYGRIAIHLLERCPRIRLVGVDASGVMLRTFHRILADGNHASLFPRVVLLQSGIEEIPLPDGGFDLILSCAVLLHNPYQMVERILRECHRLLKPSGRLILSGSFPNLWNSEGLQNFFYANLPSNLDANGPVRPYTRRRVERLFSGWRKASLLPQGKILLPRQIAGIPMPFGGAIRRLNHWAEIKNSGVSRISFLLANYIDVIAEK